MEKATLRHRRGRQRDTPESGTVVGHTGGCQACLPFQLDLFTEYFKGYNIYIYIHIIDSYTYTCEHHTQPSFQHELTLLLEVMQRMLRGFRSLSHLVAHLVDKRAVFDHIMEPPKSTHKLFYTHTKPINIPQQYDAAA